MGKGPGQTVHKEDIQINKIHNKMLNITDD
jgi:hypothetical protein